MDSHAPNPTNRPPADAKAPRRRDAAGVLLSLVTLGVLVVGLLVIRGATGQGDPSEAASGRETVILPVIDTNVERAAEEPIVLPRLSPSELTPPSRSTAERLEAGRPGRL